MNEIRLGDYEVVSLLATGGMGKIYEARDVRSGRTVALKVVDLAGESGREISARFRRESRLLAEHRHENLVEVLDAGIEEELGFLAMELVDGFSLGHYAARGVRLPVEFALAVLGGLSSAVAHIHDRGVVHRDLKPGNVLVRNDGVVKLADFGLARSLHQTQITRENQLLGTLAYMAPEALEGGESEKPGDVYALGLIGYQMLTGTLPHPARDVAEWMRLLKSTPITPLREVRPDAPEALADLIQRCIRLHPGDRPGAGELALSVRDLDGGPGGPRLSAAVDRVYLEKIRRDRPESFTSLDLERVSSGARVPGVTDKRLLLDFLGRSGSGRAVIDPPPRRAARAGVILAITCGLGLGLALLGMWRGRQAVAPATASPAGPGSVTPMLTHDVLLKTFRDPAAAMADRRGALSWILESNMPRERVLPILVEALQEDKELMKTAERRLMLLIKQRRMSSQELTALLDHPNPKVRAETIYAIGRNRAFTPEQVPRALRMISDALPMAREKAVEVLAMVEPDPEKGVPILAPLRGDRSVKVREEVAEAYNGYGTPRAQEEMSVMLGDPDAHVRFLVVKGIAPGKPVAPGLARALEAAAAGDSDGEVRRLAAEVLGRRP